MTVINIIMRDKAYTLQHESLFNKLRDGAEQDIPQYVGLFSTKGFTSTLQHDGQVVSAAGCHAAARSPFSMFKF